MLLDIDLQHFKDIWQDRLRLNSWVIGIKTAAKEDMRNKNARGEIDIDFEGKRALIKISADPLERFEQDLLSTAGQIACDIKQTVLHELLHIMFIAFEPKEDTLEFSLMEQTINTLSRTLLEQSGVYLD